MNGRRKSRCSRIRLQVSMVIGLWLLGAAVGCDGPAVESFDVWLVESGPKPISVIRLLREDTGLGLAECKAMVDGVPSRLETDVSHADATAVFARYLDAGATVQISPTESLDP